MVRQWRWMGKLFWLIRTKSSAAVVTTKQGAKPVYVSIGHMVSLETAVKMVKHCAKSRIPEPLLQAHKLATKERIRLAKESKVNITEN